MNKSANTQLSSLSLDDLARVAGGAGDPPFDFASRLAKLPRPELPTVPSLPAPVVCQLFPAQPKYPDPVTGQGPPIVILPTA